ncbi:MAG: hypothetical protein QOJ29_4558 [Thermoleophilaceae bacterium]|nr:hypothetical protein [Thermoleophilaceae bacterium]
MALSRLACEGAGRAARRRVLVAAPAHRTSAACDDRCDESRDPRATVAARSDCAQHPDQSAYAPGHRDSKRGLVMPGPERASGDLQAGHRKSRRT